MNPFGAPPKRRTQLLQALQEHGPMTCAELADLLKLKASTVSTCISHDRMIHGTKHFRIVRWADTGAVRGKVHCPVFGRGNGRPDKPVPVMSPEERKAAKRDYYNRNKARILMERRKKRGVAVGVGMFSQLVGQYELFNEYSEDELAIISKHLHRPTLARAELEKAGFSRTLASVKKKMASIIKKQTKEKPQQKAQQQQCMDFYEVDKTAASNTKKESTWMTKTTS